MQSKGSEELLRTSAACMHLVRKVLWDGGLRLNARENKTSVSRSNYSTAVARVKLSPLSVG